MARRLENIVQIQDEINLGKDAVGQRKQQLLVHVHRFTSHHTDIFNSYTQLPFSLLLVL
jgi:hypothetical protein